MRARGTRARETAADDAELTYLEYFVPQFLPRPPPANAFAALGKRPVRDRRTRAYGRTNDAELTCTETPRPPSRPCAGPWS